MKRKISLFCLLFTCVTVVFSQEQVLKKRPTITVTNGLGAYWIAGGFRTWIGSVEVQASEFTQVGLQYNHYFAGDGYDYYDYYNGRLAKGSYQAGFYLKYFLHGRFTGRKSGLYMGPELRFGAFKHERSYYTTAPTYELRTRIESVQTTVLLLRIGKQWMFGKNIVLDINTPFGMDRRKQPQYSTDGENIIGYFRDNVFVLAPSIMLGFSF